MSGDTRKLTFGVLNDESILREVSAGRLITDNFNPHGVHQASYELRASATYFDLSAGGARIDLEPAGFILLKPHQLVVIMSMETIDLPADMVARMMMKGKLFSLGLQPICTNADPGFSGRLGIVIYNSSPNFIKLPQGSAIAKLEFDRLALKVKNSYKGQHGFQTEIWPIASNMVMTAEEALKDPRVLTVGEELRRSHGPAVGNIVDRVFRYERIMLLSAFSYIFLAVVLIVLSGESRLSTTSAFLIGLVTNIASSVLMYFGTRLRRT